MAKQLSFFKPPQLAHGGSEPSGNPRIARPLCSKRPIHLIMRSSKAVGEKSFFRFKREIEMMINKHAEKCGVRVYDLANAGNHLHIGLKITKAQPFKNFLRVITGLIARLVLKAEKGSAKLKRGEKFWDARPWTRIATWGKAHEHLKSYLTLNKLEALGLINHEPRHRKRTKAFRLKSKFFSVEVS